MVSIKTIITDIMLLPAFYTLLDTVKGHPAGVVVISLMTVAGVVMFVRNRRRPVIEQEALREAFLNGETLIACLGDGRCYKISRELGWRLEKEILFLGEKGVSLSYCKAS